MIDENLLPSYGDEDKRDYFTTPMEILSYDNAKRLRKLGVYPTKMKFDEIITGYPSTKVNGEYVKAYRRIWSFMPSEDEFLFSPTINDFIDWVLDEYGLIITHDYCINVNDWGYYMYPTYTDLNDYLEYRSKTTNKYHYESKYIALDNAISEFISILEDPDKYCEQHKLNRSLLKL